MRIPVSLLCLAVLLAPARAGAAGDRVSAPLRAAMQSAGGGGTITAWVYFSDKGPVDARALEAAADDLTPRARARRVRNRGASNLVDRLDLPVPAAYIESVRDRSLRVRNVSRWLNAVAAEVPPGAVDAIAALPFVARMDLVRGGRSPLPRPEESTAPLAPPGAAFALDYGLSLAQNSQINVPALHDQGLDGSGVLICMLDAGFNNLAHPAFATMDILVTRDFVNGDVVVSDEPGEMGVGNHGTYTLSAIGGYDPGNLIGPAYGATYVLAKTENTDWERHVEEDAWVAGAEWADSLGADIISSSLGYSTGFTNGETGYGWDELDGATAIVTLGADIAASRGILVVNSAGNDGFVAEPANTLVAPCDGDSVLAVAAVDAAGVRVSFSSVGNSADGRIKPDVAARGLSVRCASPFEPAAYMNVSGTSLSCPLVAGAAALLLQARPNATNAQIMDALRQGASQAGAPDRLLGWGIINATASLAVLPTGVGTSPRAGDTAGLSAYPNPFNPATTIEYTIARRVRVSVEVFDARGARVAVLVDEVKAPGRHALAWDARDERGAALVSGVYVVRLAAGDARVARKVVLLK